MPDNNAPNEAAFFSTIRSWGITRGQDGIFGGVIDGVAQRIGMATGPARIVAVILAIFSGGALTLAYAAAWALLPDSQGRIIVQNFGRGAPNVGALVAIGILTLIAFGTFDDGPWGWDHRFSGVAGTVWSIAFGIVVPVLTVGLIAVLVIYLAKHGRESSADADTPPATATAKPLANTAPKSAPRSTPGRASGATKHGSASIAGVTADFEDTATTARGTTATATMDRGGAGGGNGTGVGGPWDEHRPTPYRSRRAPGPGSGFYLLTLAWAAASAAGVRYLDRHGELAVHHGVAWLAAFTVGLGVILMLIGASGRRLGFLGFVSFWCAGLLTLMLVATDNPRVTYAEGQGIRDIVHEYGDDWDDGAHDPTESRAPFILADAFGDYAVVTSAGPCRYASETVRDQFGPQTVINGAVPGSSYTTSADLTTVRIDGGTPLEISAAANTTVMIRWDQRDVECVFDSTSEPSTLFSAAFDEVQLIRLVVEGTNSPHTIVIEEN